MLNKSTDKPTEEANWSGPSGERWLANVDRFEHMIRPIGRALIEHAEVRPGEKVIDIGCGAGEVSLELARQVGAGGSVTGLDISPALVAEATRRAAALSKKLSVNFVLGDAARASIAAAPADCLISRFGVMFFSDPFAAFAHLHGLLRPGGRLVFACWATLKENAWRNELWNVLSKHFDLPRPLPRAPGPFAFGEPDYVRDLLGSATFKNIQLTPWQEKISIGGAGSTPDVATDFLMNSMSLAKVITDAPEELRERARCEFRDRLQQWSTPTGVQMPASVWIVRAIA